MEGNSGAGEMAMNTARAMCVSRAEFRSPELTNKSPAGLVATGRSGGHL